LNVILQVLSGRFEFWVWRWIPELDAAFLPLLFCGLPLMLTVGQIGRIAKPDSVAVEFIWSFVLEPSKAYTHLMLIVLWTVSVFAYAT